MGKVYLVGAGCGAIELYTLKAMKCIQEADCLIYDQLIDKQILDYCKDDCERIYVGKIAHHHTLSQDKMNTLMLEKAKTYHSVVRLKGGDVYVFGRGGEEGEYLYQNGIDFEVVPGISSAIGGLAYAGIPVTHRGLSGGFQVYTGSLRKDEERVFDFSSMLDDYTTYIFLMSMSKKEKIVQGFLDAGKKKETPCAIVSHASFPDQRCIIGTLENIIDQFNKHPLPNPGMIVVGNVIKKHEVLNFYERKALFGKRILVTTVGVDHYLKDKFNDLGAYVKEIITGEIKYLETKIPFIQDNLIFTSKHGVIGFMNNFMKQYHDVRKLNGVRIIAIGKKTNEILNQYGLNADYVPQNANSVCLNQELKELITNEKIYVVQGDTTSIELPHQKITVYTNQKTIIEDDYEHYDYVLFTCASSVYRTLEKTHISANCYVSMGPLTSLAIHECYPDSQILELKKPIKKDMINIVLKEVKEDVL